MIHFEREDIHLRSLASGAHLTIPIFHFSGGMGKKVYIQANIHGPEIAGCGAIYALIDELHSQPTIHGTITLVPSINPVGLDTKINNLQVGYVDFNDSSAANWNRIYHLLVDKRKDDEEEQPDEDKPRKVDLEDFVARHKDSQVERIVRDFQAELRAALEDVRAKKGKRGMKFNDKLALTAQEMALDCDYVIDLHTAADAVRFIYTFEANMPSVPYWGIPYVIELADEFEGVFDEAFLLPWVRLQKAFQKAGRAIEFAAFDKETFTPELGNADTLNRSDMQADAERIINYLRHKGILTDEAKVGEGPFVKCKHKHYVKYYAPMGGFLLWEKEPGEQVAEGETLATILRPHAVSGNGGHGDVEVRIAAQEDSILISRTNTHVVHEGLTLCHVMTKPESLQA